MPPRAAEHVEERLLRKGDVDMRLLINRSHGHARFMDFRVGNYESKVALLDQLAREERLHKIFTLVEKSDTHTWRSTGFSREGIYPSFFRTADAYVMARLYDRQGNALAPVPPSKAVAEDQVRFAERKLRKPEGMALEPVTDEARRGAVLRALDGALGPLPFARVKAPDIVMHARDRVGEGWACAEVDDSFGHATLSFAPAPGDDRGLALAAYAAQRVLGTLGSSGIGNVFGMAPAADPWTNELFSGLGFKVTARLADHLRADSGYSRALLWHRKLQSLSD